MGAALDTGKGSKGVKPNINVTPLVDVVLVLLIIFMVIIPNMQDGKPIEMVNVFNPDPDAEAKDEPLDRHDRPQRGLHHRQAGPLTRPGARPAASSRMPATRSASC
jgi:hypothetical protein